MIQLEQDRVELAEYLMNIFEKDDQGNWSN